jgi:hypothetical protein
MKCCKKFVAIAVLVALGIGGVRLYRAVDGSVDVAKDEMHEFLKGKPEKQLKRVKKEIAKLDQDILNICDPIAAREYDIKRMKKNLEERKEKLTSSKVELQTAAKALEEKVQRVSYNGKDYNPTEVQKLINRDLVAVASLKSEVSSMTKLLTAWQKDLDAMMAQRSEMANLKGELEARVAQIEADLKVLRLNETKSKLPSREMTRLDDIKATLDNLEKQIEIQTRADELKNDQPTSKMKADAAKDIDATTELINKVKAVTGDDKDADDAK